MLFCCHFYFWSGFCSMANAKCTHVQCISKRTNARMACTLCTIDQMHKCTNAEMQKCRNAEMQKCANAKIDNCTRCTNAQMHKCTNAQMQRYTTAQDAQRHKRTNASQPTTTLLNSTHPKQTNQTKPNQTKPNLCQECVNLLDFGFNVTKLFVVATVWAIRRRSSIPFRLVWQWHWQWGRSCTPRCNAAATGSAIFDVLNGSVF